MRGLGRAVFVAILLLIAGILNVIYGIGAIADGLLVPKANSCWEPAYLGG